MDIKLSSGQIPLASLPGSPASQAPGTGFGDFLAEAVSQVENSSAQARTAAVSLLSGSTGDVPSVALATQKAELSLELFQQVRNKFVSAYQEIMKMPL
jgi:flagellar hook-basal body complex protein FliE